MQFKACIVQAFLLRSADSCVGLWTAGSLGAFDLVAEEQFVKDRKNTAVLLGVDHRDIIGEKRTEQNRTEETRTEQSRTEQNKRRGCGPAPVLPNPGLSSVNGAEWRNCRDSAAWHHSSLQSVRGPHAIHHTTSRPFMA